MATKKAGHAISVVDDDSMPEWQRHSIRRALQSARAHAHARSDRFVTAATRLLQEKGNSDFTVQDVVDRSKMSIRTFYKYFASKEDLLVAVYETVLAREAVPRLRECVEKSTEPLLRLRAYVDGLFELTAETGPVARTMVDYQNRLGESRPADLARAMKPQFDLLLELIADIARTQPLRPDLTVETAARLTHHTVLAALHGRVLGAEGASDISPGMVWQFCVAGMGFAVSSKPSAGATDNARRSTTKRKQA